VVDHILPDEHQHWVSPTFICRIIGGSPSILEPTKCEAIGWFLISDIPRNELTSASAKSLASLERSLSRSLASFGKKRTNIP
jgi:hypothetical protein